MDKTKKIADLNLKSFASIKNFMKYFKEVCASRTRTYHIKCFESGDEKYSDLFEIRNYVDIDNKRDRE